MKAKFFDKRPKKFRIPASRTLRNGKVKCYTKLLVLPCWGETSKTTKKWNGEGWTVRQVVYDNINGRLEKEVYITGNDCDGRIYHYTRSVLMSGAWVTVDREVIDCQAEAAGY